MKVESAGPGQKDSTGHAVFRVSSGRPEIHRSSGIDYSAGRAASTVVAATAKAPRHGRGRDAGGGAIEHGGPSQILMLEWGIGKA